MQHHFVVVYDTDTGSFRIDGDMTTGVMPDGQVYDTETGSWRYDEPEDGYSDVAAVLHDLLRPTVA
jgi:hypothetical protein